MDHNRGIFEALNGHIYGNISGNQTIVLSHGFGCTQSVWHLLIPYLACYFKVVVFDLAFSPNVSPKIYDPNKYSNFSGYANDLLGVLEELNFDNKPIIYLGHSMSAMIGCLAALEKPQLFQHLIFLGGSPRYLNDLGYEGGFNKSEVNEMFKQIKQNYTSWVQSFSPKAIGVNDGKAIIEFEHSLSKMNPKTTLDVAKSVFLSDWRSILPKVKAPTTVIQSKTDYVVPEFVAHYMLKKLGGHVTVNIMATKGHFPQLTAHSLLLDVLRGVLSIQDSESCDQVEALNLD